VIGGLHAEPHSFPLIDAERRDRRSVPVDREATLIVDECLIAVVANDELSNKILGQAISIVMDPQAETIDHWVTGDKTIVAAPPEDLGDDL
jgi:hypothetical protein